MRKIATMLLTLAMSFSVVMGGATAASAAPAITDVWPEYGYDGTVSGGFIYFSQEVPSSTQMYLTVSACGQVLHTETINGTVKADTPSGGVVYVGIFQKRIDESMAGPTIEVSVTFSNPSLPSTSYTAYTPNSYPRSCDDLEPADDNDNTGGGSSITVSKWSTKKGTTAAKVGKTLKVTPTRATGAKVTYAWKVGSKVVDRDRAMTVKNAYRGKKVTMRVTVSKAGAKSVSKTLRYGTAR